MSNYLQSLSSARSRAADRLKGLQDRFGSPVASAPVRASVGDSGLPGGLVLDRGLGPSGEFSALRLSGGVGDLQLFEMTPDLMQTMCCGVVSKGTKFCTLGAVKCSTKAHSKKVAVFSNELYIASPRGGSAFTHHHAKTRLLSPEQLLNVLLERHTQEEWVKLLRILNTEADTEVVPPTSFNSVLLAETKVSAITPGRKRKDRYVTFQDEFFAEDRKMSGGGDDTELVIIPSTSSDDIPHEDKLILMAAQWEEVTSTMNKMASFMMRLRSTIGDDIDHVEDRISSIDARIGVPIGGFDDCITAWDGLDQLRSEVDSLANEVAANVSSARSQTLAMTEVKTALAELSDFVQILDQEQAALGGSAVGASISEKTATDLQLMKFQDDLKFLSSQVHAIRSEIGSRTSGGGLGSTDAAGAIAEVATLKLQIRLLEARLPDNNMILGGETFKSKADVKLFVEKKMPSCSFSVFHDVLTLMESLTGGHITRTEVISEMFQAERVGLTDSEARHIGSFRILLPSVFGNVKEGATTKYNLPAVKNYKEFNPQDGVSGVKDFVVNGLDDLDRQVQGEISDTFDPSGQLEAKALALDMHTQSRRFILEMCAWMDQFYHELVESSESTPEEAWELLSSIVRKMFEVIRVPRAGAATAARDKNALNRSSTILWSLIQSHRVMKDLMEARFRNHTSIAPVIILHVFRTRITRVAHASAIKRIEGRLALLEKNNGGGGKKQQHQNQKDPKDQHKDG
mmetsp:Transcript_10104/g.14571  ORF Transcript_10104/g.14571 Transcript_10104/m.14571 type:complete len:742 (-) Transcript_10104:1161-3386(-)